MPCYPTLHHWICGSLLPSLRKWIHTTMSMAASSRGLWALDTVALVKNPGAYSSWKLDPGGSKGNLYGSPVWDTWGVLCVSEEGLMSRHLNRRWDRFPEHFAELRVERGGEIQACSRILICYQTQKVTDWMEPGKERKKPQWKKIALILHGHEL